ncbi:uncharacterized protein [Nicotiana tomentosiformis]|uniref:uncharacterized protein n=1 Tax=Nicotiana tomentosiformis TaxID=4098 RepID=UPI00388CA667
MVASQVVAPPAPPTRGGGQAGRGHHRRGGHARFYAFSGRTEAITSDAIITIIVSVYHRDELVLFVLGSTYLYVSSSFPPYLDIFHDSLSALVYVSMLVGDSIIVDHVYRLYLVTIGGYETRVDLLLLSMVDFDVILGMDWLSPYHTILDCHAKTVTLAMLVLPHLEWMGTLDYIPSRVMSFLKAQLMVEKGCEAYLSFMRYVSADTPTIESVPVVRDFPDVFPVDLLGMPPNRDIDFGIDPVPVTQSISIPPYRMALVELKE